MHDLKVELARFTPAPKTDRRKGLLGWVVITLNEALRVDGIAIRRTADGRISAFFPERIDADGRRHRIVWPLQPWMRRHIDAEILRQLAERAARHERVVAS